MSTVSWVGGSGDWNNAANWQDEAMVNRLPTADDDAVINVAGISVTHSTGAHTVKSLTLADAFTLSGGTLAVTGTVDGQAGHRFQLAGGTLSGAFVTAGTTISATIGRGTLDGIALAGRIDVTAAGSAAGFSGGLTLNGGGIDIGQGAFVRFDGTQTVSGTGTLRFTDDNAGGSLARVTDAGALTLGPNVTVLGTHGQIDTSDATFSNQGTIRADGAGNGITVGGVRTTWVNEGTIEALNGGAIGLIGIWTNTGTLTETNAALYLGGTFNRSSLGTLTRSGGSVNLIGTFVNDGTLALDDTTGSWSLLGGTIQGGTVSTAGQARLLATFSGGTLDGVTLAGRLDLTAVSSAVTVTGGLTLTSGLITLGWTNFISFNGTLGGTGMVQFTDDNIGAFFASPGRLSARTALTIGPDVTVTGTHGQIDDSDGTFINQGTIRFDTAGSSILVGGVRDSWTNHGTIEALNGATVSLIGAWSNTGTISETDSTLVLGGSFATAGLGTIHGSAGTTYLTGTLNNTGQTLTLSNTTGSWTLADGTIRGGIVVTSGLARLVGAPGGSGFLDGVTLAGTLDLTGASGRAIAWAAHATQWRQCDHECRQFQQPGNTDRRRWLRVKRKWRYDNFPGRRLLRSAARPGGSGGRPAVHPASR